MHRCVTSLTEFGWMMDDGSMLAARDFDRRASRDF
jgi:hypothetical protein